MVCSLFTKIDQDGDANISFPELKELLQDVKFRQLTWGKEQTIEQVMKEFDYDGNTKVTVDEFTDRFTKWLDETKSAVSKPYRSVSSWKDLYQVFISIVNLFSTFLTKNYVLSIKTNALI